MTPRGLILLALATVVWIADGAVAKPDATTPVATNALVAEPTRVLVLDLQANGIDEEKARTIRSLISVRLSKQPTLAVLTSADLRRVVDLEAEKMQLGCTDDSCLAEMADALGAEVVVYGDIGSLGSLVVVNLNLFHTGELRAGARETVQSERLEDLPALVDQAVLHMLVAQGIIDASPSAAAPPDAFPHLLTWSLAGSGAVVGALGLASAALGGSQVVLHATTANRIDELEPKGSAGLDEAKRLQADQQGYREGWSTWGASLFFAGTTAVLLGAGLAAAGAWMGLAPLEVGTTEEGR